MNKGNNNDETAWDDILNPYEESIHLGEMEGQEAGLKAGFDDGFQLGKMKALEIGMELGYIRSIVSCWISMYEEVEGINVEDDKGNKRPYNTSLVQPENIKNRISRMKSLLELMDTFPTADFIFSQVVKDDDDNDYMSYHQDHYHQQQQQHLVSGNDNYCNTNMEPNASASTAGDITQHIHRIRAQFKLLTVQMKMPHLALKSVMELSEQGLTATTTLTPRKSSLKRTDIPKDEEW
jgi:hypothetical protein